MKNSQKELINYIRDSLRDHEEPYVLGLWEDFNRKEKDRSFPLFRYGAAAIIAFVGLYVLLSPESNFFHPAEKQLKQIVAQQHIKSNNKGNERTNNQFVYPQNTDKRTASLIKRPVLKKSIFTEDSATTSRNSSALGHMDLTIESRDTMTGKYNPLIPPSNKEINDQIATIRKELWETDGIELSARTVKDKKWDFNIHLSSSVINNTNASAGIQIGYELSANVTVSSGVSVGMLNATTKSNQSFSTNKRLESTDIRLTGVEIPFEIKYSISSQLYTSVGMSSFAVLNDNRTNNYIEQKTITESVQVVPGQFNTKTSVIEHEVAEKALPSTFDNTDHVGFYSFSIGYKNKISKKNSISIEPFIKIPARGLTDSNLKLDNGGLRVKIGF